MDNILIWLLLGGVFVGVAWWHVHENRQLARKWHDTLDPDAAEKLTQFAWGRTLQLLFVLVCYMTIIVIYDRRLTEANHVLTTANSKPPVVQVQRPQPPRPVARPQFPPPQQKLVAPAPMAIPAPARPPATMGAPAPVAAPAPARPPAATIPAPVSAVAPAAVLATGQIAAAPAANSYYPPLVSQPQSAPAAAPQPATLNDVYNPEQKNTTSEAKMDDIKKRYENIIVTYLFLNQCKKAGANDYSIIVAALAQEMASVNAPGRLQHDIVTAAQGSYKEMYSHSHCDGADVNSLTTQYNDYIKALSNNISVR